MRHPLREGAFCLSQLSTFPVKIPVDNEGTCADEDSCDTKTLAGKLKGSKKIDTGAFVSEGTTKKMELTVFELHNIANVVTNGDEVCSPNKNGAVKCGFRCYKVGRCNRSP